MYRLFKGIFQKRLKNDIANWLQNRSCDVETLIWAKELNDGTYESLIQRESVIKELIEKIYDSKI